MSSSLSSVKLDNLSNSDQVQRYAQTQAANRARANAVAKVQNDRTPMAILLTITFIGMLIGTVVGIAIDKDWSTFIGMIIGGLVGFGIGKIVTYKPKSTLPLSSERINGMLTQPLVFEKY